MSIISGIFLPAPSGGYHTHFYRKGNWDTRTVRNLLKVTKVISDRAGVQIRPLVPQPPVLPTSALLWTPTTCFTPPPTPTPLRTFAKTTLSVLISSITLHEWFYFPFPQNLAVSCAVFSFPPGAQLAIYTSLFLIADAQQSLCTITTVLFSRVPCSPWSLQRQELSFSVLGAYNHNTWEHRVSA